MEFGRAGSRLEATLTTVDGREFQGFVTPVSSASKLYANIPLEYDLRLPVNTISKIGDVIYYGSGLFMIAEGSVGFFAGPNFHLRRMVQALQTLAWSRRQSTVDPVTGLSKASAETALGMAYGTLTPSAAFNDVFQVEDSRYHFVTTAAVQVNDMVGPYTVTFVSSRVGLQFAEVK